MEKTRLPEYVACAAGDSENPSTTPTALGEVFHWMRSAAIELLEAVYSRTIINYDTAKNVGGLAASQSRYRIIREGSRMFLPPNLIPLP